MKSNSMVGFKLLEELKHELLTSFDVKIQQEESNMRMMLVHNSNDLRIPVYNFLNKDDLTSYLCIIPESGISVAVLYERYVTTRDEHREAIAFVLEESAIEYAKINQVRLSQQSDDIKKLLAAYVEVTQKERGLKKTNLYLNFAAFAAYFIDTAG